MDLIRQAGSPLAAQAGCRRHGLLSLAASGLNQQLQDRAFQSAGEGETVTGFQEHELEGFGHPLATRVDLADHNHVFCAETVANFRLHWRLLTCEAQLKVHLFVAAGEGEGFQLHPIEAGGGELRLEGFHDKGIGHGRRK